MIGRVAMWASILGAISIVLLIATVVQYTTYAALDARFFLFIAYATVAIVVAASAARGLPLWWTVALVGALLLEAALLLWPGDQRPWNYLFGPLVLSGAAAVAVALIVYRDRGSRTVDLSGDLSASASLLRPAGFWASGLALGAFAIVLLVSYNPAAFGFAVSSATLLIASGAAVLGSGRRLLALLCAGLLTPIPLITLLMVLRATGWASPDQRYEIPTNYRGWVIVQEEAPDCPELATDQGTLVYPIDASGCGCTSSKLPQGWSQVTYVAVAADSRTTLLSTARGGGGMIWGGFSGTASNRPYPFSGFFVGTEDDLNGPLATYQNAQEARCLATRP
jgi:hypothetical protein